MRRSTAVRSVSVSAALLQWAFDNGCPRSGTCTVWAALIGDLPAVQCARRNGCDWAMPDDCNIDLDVAGYSYLYRAGDAAALRGDLEMLQWAHLNGSPHDTSTSAAAAGGGQLAALQYLRLVGCE